MFTTYDKAITGGVAPAICAALFWVLAQYGNVTLSPEVQAAIITIVTAASVYFVPNKPSETAQTESKVG